MCLKANLDVPVCTMVMEIETKGTFIQLVHVLKAGMGMLYPMKAVF